MQFTQTEKASRLFKSQFDEKTYFERTKRNHFWLGGKEGQNKLKDLRIGIAGLGGMGSNLAEIMVRLGVGHIKIADPDIIELSNLNRQVIANKNTVGTKKAEASAGELRNIAEDYELVVYNEGITAENAAEFVSDLDIIIDEIDVYPLQAHVWLHQAARVKNLPLYSGFIIGLGTHFYKFQGSDYTFEDFMLHNEKEIASPSIEFLMNRFVNPPPQYLENSKMYADFHDVIKEESVPIFGATTYMAQSLIAIRAISDYLKLDVKMNGPKTPLMPKYLALDPFELTFKIQEVEKA
jgi:molybdopterin/thiamine biosynthesis adenylyltransferase